MSDAYLEGVLARENVDTGVFSPVRGVQTVLMPSIQRWAGHYLLSVTPSGSFAKGTANHSGTDIDLFISLSDQVPNPLKEVYSTLCNRLTEDGYAPAKRNVSIGVRVNGFDVDLVPAKRQNALSQDHSLYRRRADTWTKTNVDRHIAYVRGTHRQREIRILKLWRHQKAIDFPSFYLELTVIAALTNSNLFNTLSQNVVLCLQYLAERFQTSRVVDPANGNNVVSDDLTTAEKMRIAEAAARALNGSWEDLVR
jgi:hypothetical protein